MGLLLLRLEVMLLRLGEEGWRAGLVALLLLLDL